MTYSFIIMDYSIMVKAFFIFVKKQAKILALINKNRLRINELILLKRSIRKKILIADEILQA